MDITSKQTQYAEDVSAYLTSKLPYINKATLMEIAEYIGHRTARLVEDSIEARDMDMCRRFDEIDSRLYALKKLNGLKKEEGVKCPLEVKPRY